MVDVVSIIIAVISLVGSVASAGLTAYITFYIDRIKRRNEAKALTNKYRDPLVLSAYELQSRFYNISDKNFLSYLLDPNLTRSTDESVRVWTAFVIGQYWSWVYIFHTEARFLRFSTDPENREMNRIMAEIVDAWGTDPRGEGCPLNLWRGQQMAIGELMTERDGATGQLNCIGYAAFASKCEHNEAFKRWFAPIYEGVAVLAEAQEAGNTVLGNLLRRLQHLLIDLIKLLGNDLLAQGPYKLGKVVSAPGCRCRDCLGGSLSSERPDRSVTKAREEKHA